MNPDTAKTSMTDAHAFATKIVRYVISGGCGVIVNVGALFVCVQIFHIWYLAGSVIAFAVSFLVSFTLQKFWTFRDRATSDLPMQACWYLSVAIVNLGLNTLIVYILVDHIGVNYLLSQAIGSALIACESYFAYRLIFKATAARPVTSS